MNSVYLRQQILALLLYAFGTSAFAQSIACPPNVVKEQPNWRTSCRCGSALAKTRLTLPAQLRLTAACHLRSQDGGADIPLDEEINLDKYDKKGNWVNGTLYLQGRVHTSGVVRFGRSDGGDLFFYPDRPLPISSETLEPYLRDFVLVPKGRLSDFKVTPSVEELFCAEARATIEFDDLEVEIAYGAEHEGAYPTGVRVVSVGQYSKCSPR